MSNIYLFIYLSSKLNFSERIFPFPFVAQAFSICKGNIDVELNQSDLCEPLTRENQNDKNSTLEGNTASAKFMNSCTRTRIHVFITNIAPITWINIDVTLLFLNLLDGCK